MITTWGGEGCHLIDGHPTVGGFPDHAKVWLGLQHHAKALAEQGLVIGQQDRRHRASRRRGVFLLRRQLARDWA